MVRPLEWQSLGSPSNDDGNGNEKGKEAIGLDWQNINFAHASRFLLHFFAVTAWLQCETSQFHVLWRTWTQDNNFLFLFMNLDTVHYNKFNSCKIANIWQIKRVGILGWWSWKQPKFTCWVTFSLPLQSLFLKIPIIQRSLVWVLFWPCKADLFLYSYSQ